MRGHVQAAAATGMDTQGKAVETGRIAVSSNAAPRDMATGAEAIIMRTRKEAGEVGCSEDTVLGDTLAVRKRTNRNDPNCADERHNLLGE